MKQENESLSDIKVWSFSPTVSIIAEESTASDPPPSLRQSNNYDNMNTKEAIS